MTIKIDDEIVLTDHISYSQISTYLLCGYQYYLGRVKFLQEEPSVWSTGGSSFHLATEVWDRENV